MLIWNLDRFTTQYITGGLNSKWPSWLFLLLFLVIPLAVYFKIIKMIKKHIKNQEEIVEEPDGQGDPVID